VRCSPTTWTNRTQQGSRRWGGRRQVRHRADRQGGCHEEHGRHTSLPQRPTMHRVRIAWVSSSSHTTCASSTRRWRICSPRATWGHVMSPSRASTRWSILRGPLHVQCHAPTRRDHVNAQVRRTLAQEIRKADDKALDRRHLRHWCIPAESYEYVESVRIAQIV
jgi:hypothetical protein